MPAVRDPKAGPGLATCSSVTVPDGSWLRQKITSRRSARLSASAGSAPAAASLSRQLMVSGRICRVPY
jgi:hypothetical protein